MRGGGPGQKVVGSLTPIGVAAGGALVAAAVLAPSSLGGHRARRSAAPPWTAEDREEGK